MTSTMFLIIMIRNQQSIYIYILILNIIYIYNYTYTHTHVHTHIHIYIHIYIYITHIFYPPEVVVPFEAVVPSGAAALYLAIPPAQQLHTRRCLFQTLMTSIRSLLCKKTCEISQHAICTFLGPVFRAKN